MKLTFTPHTLTFIHPFKIAHGVRTSTPIMIVMLQADGLIGYGEASMPPYLGENHETVSVFLQRSVSLLETIEFPFEIRDVMKMIDELAPGNTAAKASIDIALHDLYGKYNKIPCREMYNAQKDNTPYTTFTLGIDSAEVIRTKIKEAETFKVLKVKLNGVEDKMMIDVIRSVTNKPIAVDINQGWKTKEQAIEMIEWLHSKNVLFVEQAMPKEDTESAYWLYKRSPLPLYADESVQRLIDIENIKECYHGINIKLMKCTGMYEASQMIKKARELKLKILIGCMSETSCAVSAAAQLTPLCDHADLDGPLLIKNDLFKGIGFDNGKIILNDLPGIGVNPVVID
ncbi:MAG: murI [Bacteroidetes bacterium]|jgi:L-alanine-DL-glutamate epimerase-like enolase superfamily enzyme|nr:murI [Bacteroidota bacterium]